MKKLKEMLEKRSALLNKQEEALKALENGEEVRAFTEQELADYNARNKEIDDLTATIKAINEQRGGEINLPAEDDPDKDNTNAAKYTNIVINAENKTVEQIKDEVIRAIASDTE